MRPVRHSFPGTAVSLVGLATLVVSGCVPAGYVSDYPREDYYSSGSYYSRNGYYPGSSYYSGDPYYVPGRSGYYDGNRYVTRVVYVDHDHDRDNCRHPSHRNSHNDRDRRDGRDDRDDRDRRDDRGDGDRRDGGRDYDGRDRHPGGGDETRSSRGRGPDTGSARSPPRVVAPPARATTPREAGPTPKAPLGRNPCSGGKKCGAPEVARTSDVTAARTRSEGGGRAARSVAGDPPTARQALD